MYWKAYSGFLLGAFDFLLMRGAPGSGRMHSPLWKQEMGGAKN